MSEFVYVLDTGTATQDTGAKIYKIGMTTNDPETRARQVSSATGSIMEQVVVHSIEVDEGEALAIEQKCHENFSEFRVNDRREYFSAPLKEIINYLDEFDQVGDDEVIDPREKVGDFYVDIIGRLHDASEGAKEFGFKDIRNEIKELARSVVEQYQLSGTEEITDFEDYLGRHGDFQVETMEKITAIRQKMLIKNQLDDIFNDDDFVDDLFEPLLKTTPVIRTYTEEERNEKPRTPPTEPSMEEVCAKVEAESIPALKEAKRQGEALGAGLVFLVAALFIISRIVGA
ncbi:hypothetical protein C9J01_10245 [Photobacterium rosenbergii]|uniref:Bacteriophage T5 Orf172 DNA-binding domain-containing protein n=1 Tax=Photobacterium rosenbergii TaxID=294936 RepID=A0A2T3NF73_9GAMM|nr:GIY-YIG nuclease family protein [Photobacterium rosenbergii]PSW13226.1 hypothetical protein C9J01_10245 [Photobacterium rosenbergii]